MYTCFMCTKDFYNTGLPMCHMAAKPKLLLFSFTNVGYVPLHNYTFRVFCQDCKTAAV